MVPETIPREETKEIWIARNCVMHIDQNGEKRWVVTKPFKIFSKQLVHEIVTYADFQMLLRTGVVAAREQVIDDAIQLIKKFPEPPLGEPPADLKELVEDVDVISSEKFKGQSLAIEDEVKSPIVMKIAIFSIPSKPRYLGMPDRKCPCCLTETPSCLAICVNCNSEFWAAGRFERVVPESAGPRNRWDREKILKSAEEAMRKAREAIEKMSKEDKT